MQTAPLLLLYIQPIVSASLDIVLSFLVMVL